MKRRSLNSLVLVAPLLGPAGLAGQDLEVRSHGRLGEEPLLVSVQHRSAAVKSAYEGALGRQLKGRGSRRWERARWRAGTRALARRGRR
jgi:hypothetical protein